MERTSSKFRRMARKYRSSIYIVALIYAIGIAVVAIDLFVPERYFLASVALGLGILIGLLPRFQRSPLPTSHSVAVFGFRRSGKTMLITQMFNELILYRISGVRATLRGASTIDRVTEYVSIMESRRAVGPTTQRTRFPYEANVDISRGILPPRSFKITIADYPGERSEEYFEQASEEQSGVENPNYYETTLLANQEFFRWSLECDALVFVIDTAAYLIDRIPGDGSLDEPTTSAGGRYPIHMHRAITAAWQHLMDARRDGGSKHPPQVVLTFTKCDLFGVSAEAVPNESLEKKIALWGYEPPLPEVHEIDSTKFNEGILRCKTEFADLITFLEKNSEGRFRLVFTSSLALENGRRIGVQELFEGLLPIS